MKWSEFLEKLKAAKAKKKNKGLSVPCITTLIYSGAFDSMIPAEWPRNQETYFRMYNELLIALKSKAKLPSASKTVTIGIDTINQSDEVALEMWRWLTNPLSSFDLLSRCISPLKEWGFEPYKNSRAPMLHMLRKADPKRKRLEAYVTDRWRAFFDDPGMLNTFSKLADLVVVGIVTDREIRQFGEGKEMLKFRLYTGREYTDQIVLWPSHGTTTVNPAIAKDLTVTRKGAAIIRLSEYNGMAGATLKHWIPFRS